MHCAFILLGPPSRKELALQTLSQALIHTRGSGVSLALKTDGLATYSLTIVCRGLYLFTIILIRRHPWANTGAVRPSKQHHVCSVSRNTVESAPHWLSLAHRSNFGSLTPDVNHPSLVGGLKTQFAPTVFGAANQSIS